MEIPIVYTYISAVLKPALSNSTWQNIDLTTMYMSDLYTKYSDGYITLANPSLSGYVYVDLNELRQSTLRYSNVMFPTWLGQLGNATIPGNSTKPVITTHVVKYSDAFKSNYDITRIDPEYPTANSSHLNKTAAYITRAATSPEMIKQNLLTTVNGLLHINVPYMNGVMVLDACKSVEHGGGNRMGLLNFKDLGGVSQHRLTLEMLSIPESTEELNDGDAGLSSDYVTGQKIIVDTGLDFTGKSVLLSLGGYLHVLDDSYTVINEVNGVVSINFDAVELTTRVLHSMNDIDLTTVFGNSLLNVTDSFVPEGFLDIAVLKAYLQIPQTFIILVNSETVYSVTHPLAETGLYGVYESTIEPNMPLLDTYGRLPEYWTKWADTLWTVVTPHGLITSPLYQTTDWLNTPVINTAYKPSLTYVEKCRYLELGSVKLT